MTQPDGIQLPDDLREEATAALQKVGAYIESGGNTAVLDSFKEKPSMVTLGAITFVLGLIAVIISQMSNYYDIRRHWSHYRCQPSIAPFAKFYGYDPVETLNFCVGKAVKEHSGAVVAPIYRGVAEITSAVDGAYDKVTAIESGVGGLLKEFAGFVTNFVNSFRLLGVRIRVMAIMLKEILQRIWGIFIAFTYAAISAITFGENLVCNPLVTFIGTIAGVDICCFAGGTRVRMADGSTRAIETLQIGDCLANETTVTSVYLFDGYAGCAAMVDIGGVRVSGNHYVSHEDIWIRADAHPAATPAECEEIIHCLGTDTNTIPIVSTSGDLLFTDYEETNDPFVVASAQRAAEKDLNGGTWGVRAPVPDYSLGIDGDWNVVLADGTLVPICDVELGTVLRGGGRVIGRIVEECETIVRIPEKEGGGILSAAQLVFTCGYGWVRATHWWEDGTMDLSTPVLLYHLMLDSVGWFTIRRSMSTPDHDIRDYAESPATEAPYEEYLKTARPPTTTTC